MYCISKARRILSGFEKKRKIDPHGRNKLIILKYVIRDLYRTLFTFSCTFYEFLWQALLFDLILKNESLATSLSFGNPDSEEFNNELSSRLEL